MCLHMSTYSAISIKKSGRILVKYWKNFLTSQQMLPDAMLYGIIPIQNSSLVQRRKAIYKNGVYLIYIFNGFECGNR